MLGYACNESGKSSYGAALLTGFRSFRWGSCLWTRIDLRNRAYTMLCDPSIHHERVETIEGSNDADLMHIASIADLALASACIVQQ